MATKGKSAGAGTVVLACGCAHAYQDEKHGAGKRVHNRRMGGTARCTVCGTERGVPSGPSREPSGKSLKDAVAEKAKGK